MNFFFGVEDHSGGSESPPAPSAAGRWGASRRPCGAAPAGRREGKARQPLRRPSRRRGALPPERPATRGAGALAPAARRLGSDPRTF